MFLFLENTVPVEAQLGWALWVFSINDLLGHTQLIPPNFSLSSAMANTVFFQNYQWGFHAVPCFQKFRNSRKLFQSKVTSFNDSLAGDDDHSLWGCTLSSVFHLEKQGCAGNPCEENQTPKVILVGWKDLNELFTSHVIYPSVLPDLHGNVYGVLLTPGQSIKMFRGGEHLSFSSTSLCLLIDNCHEKYFCEQLLALGNRLN